jgi:hypothetical protein
MQISLTSSEYQWLEGLAKNRVYRLRELLKGDRLDGGLRIALLREQMALGNILLKLRTARRKERRGALPIVSLPPRSKSSAIEAKALNPATESRVKQSSQPKCDGCDGDCYNCVPS